MDSTTTESWLQPRLGTIKYIALSMVLWPVVLCAVYFLTPALTPLDAPVDRFLFAVQWCMLPTLVLTLVLMNCMRISDDDPRAEDPFAGAESRKWQINQRVLTNTIEQLAIFILPLLALSVRLLPEQTWVIPVLVITWSLGRVVYWIGYQIDPHHRSLGFSWSLNTAMLASGWFLYTLIF